MTVDIIIPAYNAHETLNRALASVAMQVLDEGDSIKVTIVDDASPDGDYKAWVEYWGALIDVEQIHKGKNEGCGKARQTGFDVTDGDFVMYLDADDVLGSPFAVRSLLRAMGDNDEVMGMFIEEDADGHMITHGDNQIWMHGKLIRRRTVERFRLEFNDTRGNEDVGWNNVFCRLTDRIKYVPQVVYIWQNRNGSLVRGDWTGYAFGYGWRDFVENMAWAAEELKRRDINRGIIREFVIHVYVKLYFMYLQGLGMMPGDAEENRKKVIELYGRIVAPMVKDGALPYDVLAAEYIKLSKEMELSFVPSMTFREYLEMTGYYKDRKN